MTRQKLPGFFGVMAMAAVVAVVTVVATMTAGCGQTDAGITTAVKSKLVADDTVKAYRIDVDTTDKVVTLRGDVDSRAARDRAIELARATDGVRDVVDVMVLAPAPAATSGAVDSAREASRDAGAMIGDAGVTTAIKAKMLADTTVSALRIDVDTRDGVVALIGNVGSAAEKRRALEIARETDGVKSVKDDLKIVPRQ